MMRIKVVTLLLLSFLLGGHIISAAGYDTKITLRSGIYEPVQFLKILQDKSGLNIVYDVKLIESMNSVRVSSNNVKTLKDWLDSYIDTSRIVATYVGDYVLLSSTHNNKVVQGLAGTVQKGVVKDSQGDNVVGAFVQVVGTQAFALTDNDGSFEITLPEGARLLEFSLRLRQIPPR